MKKQRNKKDSFAQTYFLNFSVIILLALFLVFLYTYIIQHAYNNHMLHELINKNVEKANTLYSYVLEQVNDDDFLFINTEEDMQTEQYKMLHKKLKSFQDLNGAKAIFTVKYDADGNAIILVDGVDEENKAFRKAGTSVSEDVLPVVTSALQGDALYTDEIIQTDNDQIFLACYPVYALDGNKVIGAICVENSLHYLYSFVETNNRNAKIIAYVTGMIAIVLGIFIYVSFLIKYKKEKRQNALLHDSMEAAHAANKAKSTFLFNISHDIRTPMNAIIGYAELSEHHLDDRENLQRYLSNIRICGEKMLSIIDSVLELSRIENNKLKIETIPVNLNEVFDSCMLMFDDSIKKKKQTLTINKDIYHPEVYLDPTYITETFLNIVSNANKYTLDGGRIDISITQIPKEKNACEIQFVVSDNGIGMSEQFMTTIFDSFSREHSSTISGVEGTGLGMGIVKRLVDLMHGDIAVESKLGEGSTFTVTIPLQLASKEALQPSFEEDDFSCLEGKHILLAEDNELNAEIAIELLKEKGMIIDRTKDGIECIDALTKKKPHTYVCILMDIQMPHMDGYEAAKSIRSLKDPSFSNIPIIAMTANAFKEDQDKAYASGMNDYIPKPIDIKNVCKTISKYVQG